MSRDSPCVFVLLSEQALSLLIFCLWSKSKTCFLILPSPTTKDWTSLGEPQGQHAAERSTASRSRDCDTVGLLPPPQSIRAGSVEFCFPEKALRTLQQIPRLCCDVLLIDCLHQTGLLGCPWAVAMDLNCP